MKNTWFSSDWHFGHKNIVRGISKWKDKSQCRDFETLNEHDSKLVKNINAVVKPQDEIWFLGDFSFGGLDNIVWFWDRLNCKNIHIILGNHDHHIRNNKEISQVYMDPPDFKILLKAQTLFKSVQEKFIGKICDQYMTLDHYAHRVWDKGQHGAWMLHGHSHGSLHPYGNFIYTKYGTPSEEGVFYKTMDVGIDTHPEFRPYHFDEIKEKFENCVSLNVDHHNKNKN